MKHLILTALIAAAITLLPAASTSAHGCSAWVKDRRGTGYCSQNSGHSARLATACRKGGAIDYEYYHTWLSNGGVQVVYCPYGWYASSAFMQTR